MLIYYIFLSSEQGYVANKNSKKFRQIDLVSKTIETTNNTVIIQGNITMKVQNLLISQLRLVNFLDAVRY